MRPRQLIFAAVVCSLLSGCGSMGGGGLLSSMGSNGCSSDCRGDACQGNGPLLPSACSTCDCLVCQMIWQNQSATYSGAESGSATEPESIPEFHPPGDAPGPFPEEFNAPLIDEGWNEPLPVSEATRATIERIVAESSNNCDCKTCAKLASSRAESVAHTDPDCDTVDVVNDSLPPPADLPFQLQPMLHVKDGEWADRHILPDSVVFDESGSTAIQPDERCRLAFDQVLCAAANHSAFANLLAKENQIVGGQQQRAQQAEQQARGLRRLRQNRTRDCEDPCSTALRRKLMCYQALEQRNEAASNALKLYLAIAEAEAQTPQIEQALAELEKNDQRVAALRSEDLDVPLDATSINRERHRLQQQKERLQLARDKATEQLRVLIGSDLCPYGPITTDIQRAIDTAPLNHDIEVQEGLQWRADVATCQHLRCCLSDETLDAVRKALSLSSALVGTSACPPSLRQLCRLFGCDDESDVCEIQQRRRQLNELCNETTRQAQSEIRQAALEVDANARLVTIAESTVASWEERLRDLQLLREADKATAFEVTTAKLESIRSKSDLITAQLDWKRAQVELAKSKGQLPMECGYHVPDPHACCR